MAAPQFQHFGYQDFRTCFAARPFRTGRSVLPDAINAGEESTISMEYVNKGKGDVSNVEASIEGDGITATQATQYIGNVASGASGSIGFAFTADAAGEYDAKLKVTYEDADGQQQTKESPVKITVSEAPAPADPGMDVDPQENQGIPTWVWIVVAVAVVAVIAIVVVVVVRRRKKAKKAAEDDDWDWDPPIRMQVLMMVRLIRLVPLTRRPR